MIGRNCEISISRAPCNAIDAARARGVLLAVGIVTLKGALTLSVACIIRAVAA